MEPADRTSRSGRRRRALEGIVKVRIKGTDVFWGDGMTQLLDYVQQYHSLKKACGQMGMSYSKGYRIIKLAEQELGFPLLVSERGGIQGGYSRLTESGRRFSDCYRTYQEAVQLQGQKIFRDKFQEYL